jgi:ketosteroid isomerase-like protein
MIRMGVMVLGAALALAGCKGGSQAPSADLSAKAAGEIMAADRAFNDMARDKGEQAAFVYFMDPVMGMQLRSNEEPAKGSEQIKSLHDDTSVPSPLVWEPAEAYAAKSGDFGMSWGHWHWTGSLNGAPATRTGKYLTVWHKMSSGDWKGLMDTGVSDKPPETSAPAANFAPATVPEITPSAGPQDGEAPPPTPNPASHSSPENPQ